MQKENYNKEGLKVFRKKNNIWQTDLLSLAFTSEEMKSYLAIHHQFIQINFNTIINVNYIDTSLSNLNKEYVVINGQIYAVSNVYILSLRILLEKSYPSILHNIDVYNKGRYLNTVLSKSEIETEKIKYLVRKKTQTVLVNSDGTRHYFYDTLQTFNKCLLKGKPFIKIRRDCVININFLTYYQVDVKTKTGEAYIDSDTLHISRRNLPSFRRILKTMSITNKR